MYVSPDVDKAFTAAEEKAKQMKDEYISVEHLFIGLLEKPNSQLRTFSQSAVLPKKAFLQALEQVGQCACYRTESGGNLRRAKKYGQDLTELARQNKLGPRYRQRY